MANQTRQVVESVLGSQMTAQIWTSTYPPVFPFVPQNFSVGAILPMMLYLFRWGNRRGKGKFAEAYGAGAPPTISTTVARLVEELEHRRIRFRYRSSNPGRLSAHVDPGEPAPLGVSRRAGSALLCQSLFCVMDRPSELFGQFARRTGNGHRAAEQPAGRRHGRTVCGTRSVSGRGKSAGQ